MVITYLIPITQILLIVFGTYLLYQDYNLNKSKSVMELNYVKYILGFSLYLCILTIFHKTTFSTFNNAFFIIHSVLFFLVLMIYGDKFLWIESIVKLILFMVIFISIFSILTSIIFIITHTNLLTLVKNQAVYSYFIKVAPPGKSVYGMLYNPNTFTYLLVFSFYLYIFLIIYYKTTNLKYFLFAMLFINLFNLFITGASGALVTLLISLIPFNIILLKLVRENNFNFYKFYKIFFISLFSILILFFCFIWFTNFTFSHNLKDFFIDNVLRLKWLKSGSGRVDNWKVVFSIDKKHFIFGVNDEFMHQQMLKYLPYSASSYVNNSGRYHNMYISLLANYGIFALLGFVSFLVYSITVFIKGYVVSSYRRKRFILIFLIQLLVFLIAGIFEQLPLFNESLPSLLFMLTLASLFGLSNRDR